MVVPFVHSEIELAGQNGRHRGKGLEGVEGDEGGLLGKVPEFEVKVFFQGGAVDERNVGRFLEFTYFSIHS